MPAAGKYRTLISVERSQISTTPGGATVDVWAGWLDRRCRLRTAGIRDQMPAPDTQNTVLISHVVELRRDSQSELIVQEMRIRVLGRVVGGAARVLHIESVVEADDQGRELHLRCTERSIEQ